MGCLISCVACCFCNAAASLCCACLPSCKSSTSTRLVYGVIFIIILILCSICLSPDVAKSLQKIPALCAPENTSFCQLVTGYGAVYRICFGAGLFFFAMSLLMIRVQSTKDFRAWLHNGFWFFKILIITGSIIGAFFIKDPVFLSVWMIFGMIGGFIYILLQLVLLVDFAHTWNEIFVDAYETTGSKSYACALIFFTVLFYSVAFAAVVLFYFYFTTGGPCHLGKMLISINLILCIFLSIASILPAVQENMPKSGLLQASVVTCYIMFLTWSALVNIPELACNPTERSHNVTTTLPNGTQITEITADLSFTWQTGVSLCVLLLSVVYACIRTSSHTSVGRLTMAGGEDVTNADMGDAPSKQSSGQTVWDNENDGVAYSYSMFMLMLFLAILYVMMSLTSWYSPNSQNTALLSPNYSSFWVKAVSSWLCVGIYLWTLFAPIIFPDRDFS